MFVNGLTSLQEKKSDNNRDEFERGETHLGAIIGIVAYKEAALRQTGIALGALEASYVKVFVLHAQDLPAALLLAGLAKRFTWNKRTFIVYKIPPSRFIGFPIPISWLISNSESI